MTMTVAEVLRAARAKIEKPENWTQGSYALNAKGNPVEVTSRLAKCWCASGAIEAAASRNRFNESAAWSLLANVIGYTPALFNDTHTHSEVLAAFDQAIAAAEAAQ